MAAAVSRHAQESVVHSKIVMDELVFIKELVTEVLTASSGGGKMDGALDGTAMLATGVGKVDGCADTAIGIIRGEGEFVVASTISK